MSEGQYGEQYEKLIIAIMSTVIVLSLVGVTMLVRHYTPECKPSYYTYCGETANHHGEPH